MSQLLNSLKAEVALEGEAILGRVQGLKDLYMDNSTDSLASVFDKIVQAARTIPHLSLQATVAPGTGDTYLVQLVQDLQEILDQIEQMTSKALVFRGRILSVMQHVKNAETTFSAYYQISVQDIIKSLDIKLPAATVKSLAEAEFEKVLGAPDEVNLENLLAAVDVLLDQLKQSKKLAQDKYKIGTDQVNASALHLPNVGHPGGDDYSQVRKMYGSPAPASPGYDDDDDGGEDQSEPELGAQEPTPTAPVTPLKPLTAPTGEGKPAYVAHKDVEAPEVLSTHAVEAIVQVADLGVSAAEDLEARVAEWRQGVAQETVEEPVDSSSEEATVKIPANSLPETVVEKCPGVISDPFLGDIKLVETEEGVEIQSSPSPTSHPPTPKKKHHYDDEDDDEAPVTKPTPETAWQEPTPEVTPTRRRVMFDFSKSTS